MDPDRTDVMCSDVNTQRNVIWMFDTVLRGQGSVCDTALNLNITPKSLRQKCGGQIVYFNTNIVLYNNNNNNNNWHVYIKGPH